MRNWWHMVKGGRFQIVSSIFVVSFVLFLGFILFLSSFYLNILGERTQEKLGVYFYIMEGGKAKDEVYALTVRLIDDLKSKGMDVIFYSKEDAFQILEKKLPNVLGSFQQYGIQNPLPATLYVLFDNQEEYEAMKSIVREYSSILINSDEALGSLSLSMQEERIANVINIIRTMNFLLYFLVAVIVLIVMSFLWYVIRLNFFRFQKQIELELLLGAWHTQIIVPFLLYVVLIAFSSFTLSIVGLIAFLRHIHRYFLHAFSSSLYTFLPDVGWWISYVGSFLGLVFFFSILVAFFVLKYELMRKVDAV